MSIDRTVNDIDRAVGARIRVARRTAGFSQTDLGEAMGLTFQQVQKYEAGVNRVSPSRLHLISVKLGKPIAWFYDGIGAAEDSGDDPMAQLAGTTEGIKLARAFNAIKNPKLRSGLVGFAELAAEVGG